VPGGDISDSVASAREFLAIIEPGGASEPGPSLSTRLFLEAITWSMVILSIVIRLFALCGDRAE
jgi:hypothetical protein